MRACRRCGAEIVGRAKQARYCSSSCGWAAAYERSQRRRPTIVAPIDPRTCAYCGRSFIPLRRRTAVYCSSVCSSSAGAGSTYGMKERECVICRSLFMARDRKAVTCSKACRNKRNVQTTDPKKVAASRKRAAVLYRKAHPEKWAESRKNSAQRRRAIKRGAKAERFNSSEIFERDHWRCGLCGRKVAKARRYPDPLSASLDHVVPLSKYGVTPEDRARLRIQLDDGLEQPVAAKEPRLSSRERLGHIRVVSSAYRSQ